MRKYRKMNHQLETAVSKGQEKSKKLISDMNEFIDVTHTDWALK